MKLILVQGSTGALGRALVSSVKRRNWVAIGAGFAPNHEAHMNIDLSGATSADQFNRILHAIELKYPGSKLDAVLCASGGFAAGNAASANLFEATDSLLASSVQASIVAARVSASLLSPGGLLMLAGASAAAVPTPWGIAYGAAKAAVHHLVGSLAGKGSGLPENSKVVAVAPVMLDTPLNREDMPNADRSTWTPVEAISEEVCNWIAGESVRSGAIYKVVTRKDETSFEEL